MKIGQQINFIVITREATSLYSLIADGQYRATTVGRNTWKKLIGPQASLQLQCNKEGFNAVGSSEYNSKARIGIISNEQNDCLSSDSRIGFGTGGKYDDSNTCGNEATNSPDNGIKHIKTMGYIIVQWEGTDEVTARAIQFIDILILVTNTSKSCQFQFFFKFRMSIEVSFLGVA